MTSPPTEPLPPRSSSPANTPCAPSAARPPDAASPTSVSPAPRRDAKLARPRSSRPPPTEPSQQDLPVVVPELPPPPPTTDTAPAPAPTKRPATQLRVIRSKLDTPSGSTRGERRVLVVAGGVADSRASSATFSSTSFSSSVTSGSSVGDPEKLYDDRTAPSRSMPAMPSLHSEALSPSTTLIAQPLPPIAPAFGPLPGTPEPPTDPAEQFLPALVPSETEQPNDPDESDDESEPQSSDSSEHEQNDASPRSSSLASDTSVAAVPVAEPPREPIPPRQRVARPLSASEFAEFLDEFTSYNLASLADNCIDEIVRYLLDLLDFLTEKIPLPLNERLFNALGKPKILLTLVGLMQDTSVPSKPGRTFEALHQFRYPYMVGSILGKPKLADAFISKPELIDNILDILDAPPGELDAHPVVVTHTVNVLSTYLEYSPSTVLDRLEARQSFLPGLVHHLHLAHVVELINSFLPSRFVDTVNNMDPAGPSFDPSLATALRFLAREKCFHLFAESFATASVKAVDAHALNMQVDEAVRRQGAACSEDGDEPVSEEKVKSAVYNAEQTALNSIEAYLGVVERTVRIVRLDTRTAPSIYLNCFDNPSSTKTLGKILDAGIYSYSRSEGTVSNFLVSAVELASGILRAAEVDGAKRVASVAGPPPALPMAALTKEISARLAPLTMIATEPHVTPRLRMHVLELMGMVQRMCAPEVFDVLDTLRFGEVAFKMIVLHAKNSLLHAAVVRSIEAALLSDTASDRSRYHWLVKSKLVAKLIRIWRKERGAENWGRANAPRAPLLSSVVHIACVVHHWIACDHARSRPGERGIAREMLGDKLCDDFTAFFKEDLAPIVEAERKPLAGERPSRPRTFARSNFDMGTLRRTDSGCGAASGPWVNSRSGVHLVRSPSAHRFGFTEPVSPPSRSRFANIFDDDPLEADNNNDFGLSLWSGGVSLLRNASDNSNTSCHCTSTFPGGSSVGDSSAPSAGGGLRRSASMLRNESPDPLQHSGPDPFDD